MTWADFRAWERQLATTGSCSHPIRLLEALPKDAPLVFASSTGTPLAHSNFRHRVWLPALATAGLTGVHFHDLRHAGNQLIANAGANPRELMARMGHDNPRAALIYLFSRELHQTGEGTADLR